MMRIERGDANFTIEHLKESIALINKPDALEGKGIPKDWVCVIHPYLERVLLDHFKPANTNPNTMMGFLYRPLERITGRPTYIIANAPDDKIEYMSKETMKERYKSYFEMYPLPDMEEEEG
jgi:hypothetical protein